MKNDFKTDDQGLTGVGACLFHLFSYGVLERFMCSEVKIDSVGPFKKYLSLEGAEGLLKK